jgi:hypothetical protein
MGLNATILCLQFPLLSVHIYARYRLDGGSVTGTCCGINYIITETCLCDRVERDNLWSYSSVALRAKIQTLKQSRMCFKQICLWSSALTFKTGNKNNALPCFLHTHYTKREKNLFMTLLTHLIHLFLKGHSH